MIRPQASTKYNEIAETVSKLQSRHRYADRNSIEWRVLERESKQLREAVPVEGWTMLGVAYSLVGDVEETERCLGNAARLNPEIEDRCNAVMAYIALGKYSAAQSVLIDAASPEKGGFSTAQKLMSPTGAFQQFVQIAERATAMGIEIKDKGEYELLVAAAAICRNAGLTDRDVAAHMDAAGNILRKHRLLPGIRMSAQNEVGVFCGVTMAFSVDVTPEEAFQLNIELAEEEERLNIVRSMALDTLFVAEKR